MDKLIHNSPMSLRRFLLNISIVVFAVFAIQACDNDDDDDPTSPNGMENIVEVAQSDSNFSTLVSALEDAGLVSTLEGDGPFTVFAPTNDAFSDLPEGLLESLSSDQLAEILSYHVVGDEIASGDLEAEQTVEALAGGELFITTADGEVSVNDSATVVEADLEASNGILHSLDRVLLPDTYGDVFNVIVKRYMLSTLEQAILDAGLGGTLQESTENGYTVFAPNNEAFEGLPEGTLDDLSQEELQNILTYHVLPIAVLSTDLSDSQTVETVNGDTLVVEVTDETVNVTDSSGNTYQVVTPDLAATNGVVHIIDGVLLPNE